MYDPRAMIPRLALVTLLCVLALLPTRLDAETAPEGTTVMGEGFPYPVRLAVTDDVAFFRRINLPPKLDEGPATTGRSYTVTSRYWDDVLRAWDDSSGPADDSAAYYPEGGFVRARQDGEDVWLVIDLRQQAILNRYIRLARAGGLPERPSVFQVLSAAQREETLSVSIGARQLTRGEQAAFWRAFSIPLIPVDGGGFTPRDEGGIWISVSLEEGRAVQLFYDLRGNRIIDGLGIEAAAVPADWLSGVIPGALSPDSPGVAPLGVPQEEPRGGRFWWVIVVAAGLLLLGAAFWTQERLR